MDMRSVWPDNAWGAVSLTFDDGRQTQRDVAIPMMEKRNFRATFYLNPRGDTYSETLAPWKDIAAQGHEIGNHTMAHTCSRNFSQEISNGGLESMTLDDIERDVLEAERRLNDALPGTGPRSFCYPCYMDHVGMGRTRMSYVPVIAKHFVAGRASGEYGFANHPFNSDLHHLASVSGERMSGEEMIGLAERAVTQGRWIVFTFHDIGAGRLGCSTYDFGNLLDHLALHRSRFWVAPVRDVAQYLTRLREENA